MSKAFCGSAYPIDLQSARVDVLMAVPKSFGNRTAARAFLDAAIPVLDDAKNDDKYDLITPLLQTVRQAISDAADPQTTKKNLALVNELERLQKEYAAIKPAAAVLNDRADDPDANLTLGKFYCFQKQDWDRGLPLLAKGGDARLADAAKQELDAPSNADDQVKLADAWNDLVKTNPAFRSQMLRRADHWYSEALSDLDGKVKERVEREVIDLAATFTEVRGVWEHLDLSAAKAVAVGDCYLRVPGSHVLATKQASNGPVEIAVVFRAAKAPVRLTVLRGREEAARFEFTENSAAFGVPGSPSPETAFTFKANAWYSVGCRITENSLEVSSNGVAISSFRKNDVSKSQKVELSVGDQSVEIQSFAVRALKP